MAKQNATTTSRYVYAGQNTLLAEHTNGAWTSYLWFGGRLIGLVRNNQLYFVSNDHLGRPELVTNASRQIVWRANNEAFGRKVTADAIGGLHIGFPGQYYDTESGLAYNGYRDYDELTGGYTQADPMGLDGGLNTYVYASANPVMRIDPTGLTDWSGTSLTSGLGPGSSTVFTMSSDCQDGKSTVARVSATGGGASALPRKFGSPLTYAGASVRFSDGNGSPDPRVFEGEYVNIEAAIAFPIGVSYGSTRLGGAVSPPGFSMVMGYQGNAGSTVGLSTLIWSKVVECGCNAK